MEKYIVKSVGTMGNDQVYSFLNPHIMTKIYSKFYCKCRNFRAVHFFAHFAQGLTYITKL